MAEFKCNVEDCDGGASLNLSCKNSKCSLFEVKIQKTECNHNLQLPQHRCKRCGEIIHKLSKEDK